MAEAKLRRHFGQITAKEYNEAIAEVKATPYYDEEFEAYVDNYVLYVRSQIGEGDTPYFEQRVDFSEWVPDGFGTADVVIMSENKVRVIDLKFGKGVAVDAEDNPQLRLYGLGGWYKYKDEFPNITHVEYTIHQPRKDSITTETVTLCTEILLLLYLLSQEYQEQQLLWFQLERARFKPIRREMPLMQRQSR